MEIKDGKEMVLDNNTYFKANSYALLLTNTNPFTIRGGIIYGIYNQGNLVVDNGTYVTRPESKNYAIYNEKRVTMNGGTIEINNENSDAYGVYNKGNNQNNYAYFTMNGGLINISANNSYGINGTDWYNETTINGGEINITTKNYGYGVYGYNVVMNDGNVIVHGNNGGLSGIYYRNTINAYGGRINVESDNPTSSDIFGIRADYGYESFIGENININSDKDCVYIPGGQSYYTVTIGGGTYTCGRYGILTSAKVVIDDVNINSVSHAIYGDYSSYNHYYADVTLNSGNVISSEGNGIYFANYSSSYSLKVGNLDLEKEPYIEGATTGIYMADDYGVLYLNKGKVVGKSQYGVYTKKIANIGNDDGTVSSTTPVIKGELYGLYTENNGQTNYYDGILKGQTDGYYGYISGIPDAYTIKDDNEVIDEVAYEIDYLVPFNNFVKVGDVEYNSLNKAIAAIESAGTMELIASAPIKAEVTIPAEKNITLDLAGYSLTLSKKINNNGVLSIDDSSESKNGGITCTIENCLYNTGTLNIENGTYVGSNTIIYNFEGTLNFDDGYLEVKNTELNHNNVFGIYGRVDSNSKNSIINITGGTIKVVNDDTYSNYYTYGIYHGGDAQSERREVNISGGIIDVTGYNAYGVKSVGNASMTGGKIVVNSKVNASGITVGNLTSFSGGEITITSEGSSVYGLDIANIANITGGTINVTSTSSSTTGVSGIAGIDGIGSTVGGTLTINSSHSCFEGIGTYSKESVVISDGEYNCGKYGIYTAFNIKITGGSFNSKLDVIKGYYSSYNHYYPNFEILGGTFISEEGNGIYYPTGSDYYDRKLVIGNEELEDGPYIEGATNGVYINDGKAFIYNGTIVGKTANGVYNKGTLTFGTLDGNIDITKPVVVGENYGLYLESGTTNFYDGILKGKMNGYYGTINSIEPSAYVNDEVENIGDVDWIKSYLKIQSDIVKNVDKDITYNNIQTAIDESDNGDVLRLIDNVQLFYDVTIPSESSVVLDFDGYSIRTTKSMINNGTLNIMNDNDSNNSSFSTGVGINIIKNYGILNINNISMGNSSSETDRIILTYDSGVTTLDDVDILSVNNVTTYSGGTININNCTLNATDTSVYNEGITNVSNSVITGNKYGIYSYTLQDGEIINSTISSDEVAYYKYNRSSTQKIQESNLLGGYVYNDSGTLNIKNGLIKTDSKVNNNIINKAIMNIDGTVIEDSCDIYDTRYYEDYTSIKNTSELLLKNVTYSMTSSNNGNFIMIDNTGNYTSNNSAYNVDRTINFRYCSSGSCDHYYVYGINNTGNVNMLNDEMNIYDTSNTTSPYTNYYGIRNTKTSSSNLDGVGISISGGALTYGLLHESSSTSNVLKDIDFKISDVLTAYGAYLDTGIVNIQSGSIQNGTIVELDENGEIISHTNKNVGTAYGVYINKVGTTLELGVKDESDKAGTAEADVSISNPLIIGEGSELGVGVKKYDGYFKFYDGILIGNTQAKPETTTETDHINYVTKTYYDDENGFEYCVLEYSRSIENKHDFSASMNDVFYKTLNAAINRSDGLSTIIMQSSLQQNVVIPEDKNVILDFNNHILSGTVTNNGTATLINGEITTTGTTYDIAVINNGVMYIGRDDNNIIDDYVIILGNSVGLQNNGKVYMYDGYIRGTIPVSGKDISTLYKYRVVEKEIDGYDTVLIEELPSVIITPSTIYNYEYDDENLEQTFTAPENGYYLLEIWGAQGGYALCNNSKCGSPGYGGYAKGAVYLNDGDTLYINIGGQGQNGQFRANALGGYNGGGSGSSDGSDDEASGGGGGATHIATSSGLLSTFENNKTELLIVAGGGGGASYSYATGSGGGYCGGITSTTSQNPVNQNIGYAFGIGENGVGAADSDGVAGGGGGYYGGYANNVSAKSSGSGGSGYIGNSILISIGTDFKVMYGYGVEETTENDISTVSTSSYSTLAESGKAKAGDGYARITKLEIEEG